MSDATEPTATPAAAPAPAPRRRRAYSRREKSGMAILMVVTAIAICMVIVNEFGTRTNVDTLQARNDLDQMRAHFLARSALDVTDLVLRLQKRLDDAARDHPDFGLDGIQITDYADTLMGAFGGTPEEVEGAVGLSIGEAKGLGSDIGSFGVHITPIDGKINLNCAAAGSPARTKLVRGALEALLYPPAFDPIFEEPDAEGWRRDRKTQIEAIMDYIDPNFDRADTPGAPEDYGYEGLKDKYKAKNHAIDSVDELKLVRGVDDRFWSLFGRAFRVTGECEINLRALDDPMIIAALITLAPADQNDPLVHDFGVVWTIANLVISAKQFGIAFTDSGQFVEFVKDPAAAFQTLTDPANLPAGGAPAQLPTNLPQLPAGVTGINLDKRELDKIAKSKPVRLYDVEVYGEVARGGFLNPLRRTIHATWDQEFVLQQSRIRPKFPSGRNNGAWLYLREE